MLNQTKHAWAHAALLCTNIFFAINFTAVKYLVNQHLIQPFGLNLVRVLVTVILLWILFLFKPTKTRIAKTDWLRFAGCALTGIAINQMLFIKGLSMTLSIHASLLMLCTPILITFIAAWLLKERLNAYKIAGLLIGVTGATVLILFRQHTDHSENILLGDVLVLLNAVSYTFYFILVRPLMHTYPPIQVIRMVFSIGLLMMLPFCWHEFTLIPWQAYQPGDWLTLFMIVFAGTFLAYLFNVYGIRQLGASVAGAYIYVQPVFAAIIAALVLHESLSVYKLLAAACIFIGVYLVNRKDKTPN
jgi:drug/metabolite transporter (DMT)-like permease